MQNILSEEEIKNIKQLKFIINQLINIEHNCIIEDTILNKYINILKFILDKTDITQNELFVYHFINKEKITTSNIDFIDLYNDYINNFYNITKNDIDFTNKIIEDDLSNIEIDNETNCETNPEEETIDEENDYVKYNVDEVSENELNEEEGEEGDEEDDEEDEEDEEDYEDIENIEDKNENDKTKKII